MTASLNSGACIAAVFLGTLLGSLSYAQVSTPGKSAEQAIAEKPATQPTGEIPSEDTLPEGFTASLNTAFYSKYVWRGLELSKDSLVIFPSLTVGYKGFAANLWFDVDTDFNNPPPGKSSEANLEEIDFTATYSNRIDPLKLDYTLGYIYYYTKGFYGDSRTSNAELFTTLGLDVLLKPTLSVYSEIMTGTAWYFSLSRAHYMHLLESWEAHET